MTKEQKELVLKDICARLPHGVHVEISWEYSKADIYTSSEYYEFPNIDSLLNIFWDEKCVSIRPYLRPMSSMTEEETKEYAEIWANRKPYMPGGTVDFFNAHHLDYRGLIPMGLALEATEGMY